MLNSRQGNISWICVCGKREYKQLFHTLTCPVEGREFAKVPVIPFLIFGNGEESDPFTWGGSGGGGGGGGDCVMNWEDIALVNGVIMFIIACFLSSGQTHLIWILFCWISSSDPDVNYILRWYLWGGHVPVLGEHVRGGQLRDGTQRRVMIGWLVWWQSITAVFI